MHVIMVRLLEFLDGDNLPGSSVPRLKDLSIGPKWFSQIEEILPFSDEVNDLELIHIY
jgi:hypothetical protein